MSGGIPHEAVALLEIEGLPRTVRAQDAALKRAPVHVLACTPVSPGKAILIFTGDVASVQESLAAADEIAGSRRLDRLFLPGVHPGVIEALTGTRLEHEALSLAILELSTVAASLEAADAALKAAEIRVGRLHPASGFGGKGYFTILGQLSDVEAAVDAAASLAAERLLDQEIIPAPHSELCDAAFKRPWNLDPAG